jgi:two-component system CheB/CheR fusion protein
MASNEELQSSNEELQSVNEELYTVNAENQEKIEILNRLNADLDSMAKAAAIATVFVDSNLLLTRFTPEATSCSRSARPTSAAPSTTSPTCSTTPTSSTNCAHHRRRQDGAARDSAPPTAGSICCACCPTRCASAEPRGAVATFVDITVLRDAERLQAVLDSLPEHVAVLADNGEVSMVNRAWQTFATAHGAPDSVGQRYPNAWAGGQGFQPEQEARLRAGIEAVMQKHKDQFSTVYPYENEQGVGWFAMHAAPIIHGAGGVVVSHVDISDWYRQDNDT